MDKSLVQAILVNKAGTHEEMIAAVALAALHALRDGGDNPAWQEWLAGRFTKSVRRTNKSLKDLQEQLGGALVERGGAVALAVAPMRYEEMPKAVRESQVQGTNREPSGLWPREENGLHLLLNADLQMSTGKAAAQVGHGVMAWWLQAKAVEQEEWLEQGERLYIEAVSEHEMTEVDGVASIHDAGLTEIEAGSLTVKVLGLAGSRAS